jgi:uncharacterized tellurite resistance protein B-like protein
VIETPNGDGQSPHAASLAQLDRVIADPLRFKLQLGIGEDAFLSLKLKKGLQELWDAIGMGATAGAVAASPVVATTFFASTASGGLLSLIGLGTAAATPIGWVAAAALASGTAYFGVLRLYSRYSGGLVDTIPKFINTPIDVIAVSLFDMIGSLAVRVGNVDGDLSDAELAHISTYFISEWGYDARYVNEALAVLVEGIGQQTIKEVARNIADFQQQSPDCNPKAMRIEIVSFLRAIAQVDGRLDEREDHAIDVVDRILAEATAISLRNAKRSAGSLARRLGEEGRKAIKKVRPDRDRSGV